MRSIVLSKIGKKMCNFAGPLRWLPCVVRSAAVFYSAALRTQLLIRHKAWHHSCTPPKDENWHRPSNVLLMISITQIFNLIWSFFINKLRTRRIKWYMPWFNISCYVLLNFESHCWYPRSKFISAWPYLYTPWFH